MNSGLLVEDSEWCRFRPTDVHELTWGLMEESRFVRESDWIQAKDFVRSSRRPSLVLQLLASAEAFAGTDHRRAALVEAVTTLEVAISDFAKRPKAQEAFGAILAERFDTPSLKAQVEHVGLSGGVRYLLAVIFPPEQLPTEILKTCQRAIVERNGVVHYGQRDVAEDRLRSYLASIRQVCAILRRYQENDSD